jgi:prevent-host-death family protein
MSGSMIEVQATEAKAHFARLLDQVERGETIVITRHGKAIATLVPQAMSGQRRREEAIAAIKKFRASQPSVSVEEILAFKHEEHRA